MSQKNSAGQTFGEHFKIKSQKQLLPRTNILGMEGVTSKEHIEHLIESHNGVQEQDKFGLFRTVQDITIKA